MKHSVIRMLSVVLVLALCLSLFAGLTFAASVNYQTGNPNEDFSNVILNWGKRGTTATFLSPNAEEFYEDNQITYEDLAKLSGSSTVSAVPNSDLYEALQKLMQKNHSRITSYKETCDLYSYTDCQENDRNKLTCFYSGIKIGPNWDSGATWNREHTWPNSKGFNGSDEDDIMMLRPTSSSVNSSRGNKCYGPETTTQFYDPNGESNGQYNLHGDVARIALYVYVRWGNTEKLFGADGVIQSLDVLLDWMEEDPVDTWEMGRNDSVESITGTRNVFVDYPELAFALFNEDVPAMETPSGEAMNGYIDYDIVATTNNAAWGTVSVSGQVINASPATGFRVAGYTLVNGAATVTANGNAFTVKPTSDCVVQINFEPRRAVSVNYYENGTNTATANVYSDDTIRLPASSVTVDGSYTFMGWITDTLAETTEKPAQLYVPDQLVTVTEDMSFYALYSRVEEQGSGNSTAYALFTGNLEEGSYLVTYENGAMKASVTKNRMDYLDVTPVGTTIDNPDPSIIWELAFTDDGYVTLYNKATATYAGANGTKSQAKLLSSITDYAKWTVSEGETYDFVNLGNENKGVSKTLRRNATYGFACYATATGGALTLYKQSSGTVYYSTSAVACQHKNTTDVAAQEPTCTEAGYTAGVFCEDCKTYLSGHEKQNATGHSYDAVVTPPTVTEGGYTTYTCTICGDTYTGDVTEALGEQYTVTFRVPAGVEPIEKRLSGKAGITLPTAGVPEDAEGYTFAGWVTEQVEDTDVMPTVYKGTYTTDANVTLYALYTYTVGGSAGSGWNLVTDAASLSAGDSVVLAHSGSGVVDSVVNKQFLTAAEAVFSEDGSKITQMPDTAVILVLGKNGDYWTLSNEEGQALGATAVKKIAFGSGNTDWTITIDENAEATVANADEARGRFLYNQEYTRFTTYTSSVNNKMFMPQLYKLTGGAGTAYYTTLGENYEAQGVTVSGTVTSGTNTTGTITVELWAEGADQAAYTVTTADGNYTIENVAAGNYTVKISKVNHVTRAYALTVAEENVTLDGQICLLGDADMNGTVNILDVAKAYAHIKGTKLTDDYAIACADVKGGGTIVITDVAALYAHFKGTNKLY